MSEEDLNKETIGGKASFVILQNKKISTKRPSEERQASYYYRIKLTLFMPQLAESLPFELLEEYKEIFSFFDRCRLFKLFALV